MNVNLDKTPYTDSIYFFENGILDGTIPISLDPTGNPVYFEFSTTTISNLANITYTPNGSFQEFWVFPSERQIVFPNNIIPIAIADGDTVTIFDEVFTAKTTNPGKNEFFTCPAVGAAQRLLSMQSLADAINYNENLNYRYTAIASTATTPLGVTEYVYIKAKYTGTLYNFNVGATIIVSFVNNTTPNYEVYYTIPGTDANRGQHLQNYEYAVFLEVWTYDDSIEFGRKPSNLGGKLLGTLSQKWKPDNKFIFNISEFISGLTEINFEDYNDNINYFKHKPLAIKDYYIRYGEQFNGGFSGSIDTQYVPSDDPNNITNTFVRKYYMDTTNTPRWCSKGVFELGINPPPFRINWESVYNSIGFTNGYQTINTLSDLLENKLRRRESSPEYIYFYYLNDEQITENHSFRLATTPIYIDNFVGTTTYTHLTNFTAGTPNGLYVIDANLSIIGFYAIDNVKRVRTLQHQIEVNRDGNWVALSNSFSYSIDLNDERPEKYFSLYWKNSKNVFDKFVFEGTKQTSFNTKRTEYERSQSYGEYTKDKKQKAIYKNENQTQITINSGWVNKNNFEYLKNMVKSTEWYIIENNYNEFDNIYVSEPNFVSINIKDFDWEEDRDKKLFNCKVTITYSLDENSLKD